MIYIIKYKIMTCVFALNQNLIAKSLIGTGAGLLLLSLAMLWYGNNLLNRKTCIICGAKPACFVGTPCKPNGLEGIFWYMFRRY